MVKRVSTGSSFEETFGYSRAVRDGDMVYVSGTTGYDYSTMVMPEDPGAQAANALATIEKALNDAGAQMSDVLKATYFVTDPAYIDAVVAAVGLMFRDVRPAATMVICGLIRPEMKIEIEVTARTGAAAS